MKTLWKAVRWVMAAIVFFFVLQIGGALFEMCILNLIGHETLVALEHTVADSLLDIGDNAVPSAAAILIATIVSPRGRPERRQYIWIVVLIVFTIALTVTQDLNSNVNHPVQYTLKQCIAALMGIVLALAIIRMIKRTRRHSSPALPFS